MDMGSFVRKNWATKQNKQFTKLVKQLIKTAIETRIIIQKTKKKKHIHRKIDKNEAYFR